MAYQNTNVLLGVGVGIGALALLAWARRAKTAPPVTGSGGVGLEGSFTALAPQAILLSSGQRVASKTVRFTGTVSNSGNVVSPSLTVRIRLSVGGVQVESINLAPFTVPGGSRSAPGQATVTIAATALESDPPGNITAQVDLLDATSGSPIGGGIVSASMGTVESTSNLSLGGSFS